jgi:nicotinamidase-related amidase
LLQQPRTALIITDVQNDFSAPNGSLHVAVTADIISGINALCNSCASARA